MPGGLADARADQAVGPGQLDGLKIAGEPGRPMGLAPGLPDRADNRVIVRDRPIDPRCRRGRRCRSGLDSAQIFFKKKKKKNE